MSAPPPRDPLEARIIATALKAYVDGAGTEAPLCHPDPAASAVSGGLDPEARVLAWAWQRGEALGLIAAWRQARRRLGQAFLVVLLVGAGMGLGLLTGAGLLSGREQLNVYAVWLALIGVHTLFLLIWCAQHFGDWLALTAARLPLAPDARARLHWLDWLRPTAVQAAAWQAEFTWTFGRIVQPWGAAVYLHAYWLASLSAAWLALIAWLIVEEVNFGWETTLLGAEHFAQLTASLACLPAAFGFSVPGAADVARSAAGELAELTPAEAAELRQAWAGFLLGSVLVYAWVPRAALLGLCYWQWRRRRQRFRLDLADPEYAAFLARPLAHHGPVRVLDADAATPGTGSATTWALLPARPLPEPEGAILGFELAGYGDWPPAGTAHHRDLGRVDDGTPARLPPLAERRGPLTLCVRASQAPDRGALRWLSECVAAWPGQSRLWVSDLERAAQRLEPLGLAERLQAWAEAGHRAGVSETWVEALPRERAGGSR